MSSNVGLTTPRGSGTSGYVQRNLSALKPRGPPGGTSSSPYPQDADSRSQYRQRQPDREIIEHDRKREIEVKIFELRDRLEDEGVDEDEIDSQADALRESLQKGHQKPPTQPAAQRSKTAAQQSRSETDATLRKARSLKPHQVHDLAEAKIAETDRLRKALGIREDYVEGSYWTRQHEKDKSSAVEDAEGKEAKS